MFNKKITTSILALLCVSTMAMAAFAPVAAPAANEGIEVASDIGFIWDCF